jgi:hypothetical protein
MREASRPMAEPMFHRSRGPFAVVLVGLVGGDRASAQIPRTSFWLGAQIDVVGPSGSPALYGGQATLAHRFGASPWEAALVMSAASRRNDALSADEPSYYSTFGLYSELHYFPGAGRGPYLVAVVGLANTRVDDRFASDSETSRSPEIPARPS